MKGSGVTRSSAGGSSTSSDVFMKSPDGRQSSGVVWLGAALIVLAGDMCDFVERVARPRQATTAQWLREPAGGGPVAVGDARLGEHDVDVMVHGRHALVHWQRPGYIGQPRGYRGGLGRDPPGLERRIRRRC